jgi:hypothetical protein
LSEPLGSVGDEAIVSELVADFALRFLEFFVVSHWFVSSFGLVVF